MFDRKPALIACCTGTADVRHAVDFAREHRLLTAVRSGGHSVSGKSTCDGGLVIDLQSMQGVRVEPEMSRRAIVEAGSLLGQLDHESAAFGLATTAGIVSHTGAAGLTLGGGFGRLGRRFGLACDNVARLRHRHRRRPLPARDRRAERGPVLGTARRRRQFRRRDRDRVPRSPHGPHDPRRLPDVADREGPRRDALPSRRAGRLAGGALGRARARLGQGRADGRLRGLLVGRTRRRRGHSQVPSRDRKAGLRRCRAGPLRRHAGVPGREPCQRQVLLHEERIPEPAERRRHRSYSSTSSSGIRGFSCCSSIPPTAPIIASPPMRRPSRIAARPTGWVWLRSSRSGRAPKRKSKRSAQPGRNSSRWYRASTRTSPMPTSRFLRTGKTTGRTSSGWSRSRPSTTR